MRPGLVALGAAFLTVGAVTVLSVYVLPGPTTDRDVSTDIPPSTIGPNETKMALLEGANATSGSFHLDWQSTGAVSVLVYNAPGCTTPEWQCISGDPLDEWSRSISGNFAVSGRVSFPFLLVWTDVSGSLVTLTATAVSHESRTAELSMWSYLWVDLSAGSLALVGVVAVFLGLFLRRGVFPGRGRPRAPPVVVPPLDVEGLDAITGPRTGPYADGLSPAPRGPPAPPR